jgi:hypothetical protein
LTDLLAQESTGRDALPDCLGDAYVLQAVPMLATQRQFLLGRGYRFVAEEQLPQNEQLVTSLQLLRRLTTRVIPYRRTLPAVREIVAANPHLRLKAQVFAEMVAANYTFHEGAHAVWYETVLTQEGPLHGARLVETLLASEGFAVAFNKMTQLLGRAEDPVAKVFFALTMSVNVFEDSWGKLAPPLQEQDFRACAAQYPAQCLRFLSSAGLLAMLRPDTYAVKPALTELLAAAAGLPRETWPIAAALMKLSLQEIPNGFRDGVTVAFFAYNNLLDEYRSVLAQPLEQLLGEGSGFDDHWAAVNAEVWRLAHR